MLGKFVVVLGINRVKVSYSTRNQRSQFQAYLLENTAE